jgi:hypothetical protein
MAILKKKIDLDSQLIEKIQYYYGEKISMTYIVSELLWALVREHESSNISIPSLLKKSAKEAKDALSISTEIPTEDL